MSLPEDSLKFASLFEGELLLELMMRFWKHPLANETELREFLIEEAAAVLQASIKGEQLIDTLPADCMNLVAAIWYCEWSIVTASDDESAIHQQRKLWLEVVRKALPSCFCHPDDLV